jgi:hypothetical protein
MEHKRTDRRNVDKQFILENLESQIYTAFFDYQHKIQNLYGLKL